MILQELNKLFSRLHRSHHSKELPEICYSKQKVSFSIVIERDGTFVKIKDERILDPAGKKRVHINKIVPFACARSSNTMPYFLCDNVGYFFGCRAKKALEKANQCKEKHLGASERLPHNSALRTLALFFEKWHPEQLATYLRENQKDTEIEDCLSDFGIFRISGEDNYIHENPEIQAWWEREGESYWYGEAQEQKITQCLITAEELAPARIHEPIKGLKKALPSGAKLVSFDKDSHSFQSYGKKQCVNAPVSQAAVRSYVNALNWLLSRSESRIDLADSAVVFWTDAEGKEYSEEMEQFLSLGFDASFQQSELDEGLARKVGDKLRKIFTGKYVKDIIENTNTRFFILGLAPNVSRLSVQFYMESTLGAYIQQLKNHHCDMELEKRGAAFKDRDFYSARSILRATLHKVKKEKDDAFRVIGDIPPIYTAAIMRAILEGGRYPDTIAHAILRRIKTNMADEYRVSHLRCGYLKAWLLRKHRNEQSYSISSRLDFDNREKGYLLGRLFACLHKTQLDGLKDKKDKKDKKDNKHSIREAYYAQASCSPASVFSNLLKLFIHHLGKLKDENGDPNKGLRKCRESLAQEILSKLSDIPISLDMEQQALFSIGYYLQTQNFYIPKSKETPASPESETLEKPSSVPALSCRDEGYLLGRLFATLYKTQEDSQGEHKLNRSIRESHYAQASSAPASSFNSLLPLFMHHLAKLRKKEKGKSIIKEKLAQEILAQLQRIPVKMDIKQQALFSLGYYHQMYKFYHPKTNYEQGVNSEIVLSGVQHEECDEGYLLGRLFATLYKTQEESQGELNRSIIDNYYTRASSAPASVFNSLIPLFWHHLAKLRKKEKGKSIVKEKLAREIFAQLKRIPAKMDIEQQAFFSLGYHQQMYNFYHPKAIKEKMEKVLDGVQVGKHDEGYLLGLLFAAFYRTQQESKVTSKGIRDSYYARASSAPASVFPFLSRVNDYHIQKLPSPAQTHRRAMIKELEKALEEQNKKFPPRLDIEQQSLFNLGYHQQMQSFYTSRDAREENQEQ